MPSASSKLKFHLLWISVLAVSVALGVQFVGGRLSVIRGGDSANYVLLAKAITDGHGYSYINIPGYPQHTQLPPFLPLLLSPVIHLFGYNFAWMRLVIVLFGIA